MKKAFTTLEMIVSIAFLLTLLIVFLNQNHQINQKMRDQQRKASVNSIYFNLKEIYFKKNGYYPETLKPDMLDGVDPAIFSDPNKILLGDPGSDYEYTTSDCQNNHCKYFTISSKLELEQKYVKQVSKN